MIRGSSSAMTICSSIKVASFFSLFYTSVKWIRQLTTLLSLITDLQQRHQVSPIVIGIIPPDLFLFMFFRHHPDLFTDETTAVTVPRLFQYKRRRFPASLPDKAAVYGDGFRRLFWRILG
ncbi:hypothetical protein QVD17_41594 [Tagetes erecta]|uniref:Uncharacterized protein n=1 Tax=Tagetes erecta TaxID=13708 RepID=A0AAD8JPE9_TARER|nr:hypothetical protein QVD17_41594 [Tagetes erecta]